MIRAAYDLGDDVRKVCGSASEIVFNSVSNDGNIVVGTIGKSSLIDELIRQKRICRSLGL